MVSVKVVTIKAIEATPANFEDYGQVIEASSDSVGFGPHDAQLDLTQGIPRFSIFTNLQKWKILTKFYMLIFEIFFHFLFLGWIGHLDSLAYMHLSI